MTSTSTTSDAHALLQFNPAHLVLNHLHEPDTLTRLERFASKLTHYLQLANESLTQLQRNHAEPDGVCSNNVEQELPEQEISLEEHSAHSAATSVEEHSTSSSLPDDAKIEHLFLHPDLAQDLACLSDYSRLLLENIELFRSQEETVVANKPIVVGQLGYRCVHCAHSDGVKQSISLSFPRKKASMRDSLNAIANQHLRKCSKIPAEQRKQLIQAKSNSKQQSQKPGRMGLKPFVEKMARLRGIQESQDGLRLEQRVARNRSSQPARKRQCLEDKRFQDE